MITIEKAIEELLSNSNSRGVDVVINSKKYRYSIGYSSYFYERPDSRNIEIAIKTMNVDGNLTILRKIKSNKFYIYGLNRNRRIEKEIIIELKRVLPVDAIINIEETIDRIGILINSVRHKNRYHEIMREHEINN
jgi:hypothetical protein